MSRFVSLAGEAVADLAALCAEPGRLSRGRTLFRKGAVVDLVILKGSVMASVRGSQGDVYEATVGTALAPPGVTRQVAQAYDPNDPESIDNLIGDGVDICPREVDVVFACDCADWDEPCKHVVAALFAVADRVDLDETELLRWRAIDVSTASSPVPSKASKSSNPSADDPTDRSAKLSELEALLGNTAMRVPSSDDPKPEPVDEPLEPAMALFFGVGDTITAVDVSGIATPAPLFTDMQLGPLADLGPALAEAVTTIVTRLENRQPD